MEKSIKKVDKDTQVHTNFLSQYLNLEKWKNRSLKLDENVMNEVVYSN